MSGKTEVEVRARVEQGTEDKLTTVLDKLDTITEQLEEINERLHNLSVYRDSLDEFTD